MANIFGMIHDIDNQLSALETARGLLHQLKFDKLWSTNHLKLDRSFYPPSVNSASYTSLQGFTDGDQQTELHQTLPNGGQ